MDKLQKNGGAFSLAAIFPSRSMLALMNSFFLILLAFIAGYNFKGYQVRRTFNTQIGASEQYMQEIKHNYEKSRQILKDLNETYNVHYENQIAPETFAFNIPESHVSALDVSPPPSPVTAEPEGGKAHPSAIAETVSMDVPPAPVTPDVAPAVPPKPRPVKLIPPAPTVPFVHVSHRIQPGDVLSALVPQRDMPYFLQENPDITQPDLIFPGQAIKLRVPLTNIERGTYMNRYFVRPDRNSTYSLNPWLYIPEDTSVLNYLVHEQTLKINRKTIPFIDLSKESNLIKDKTHAGAKGSHNTLTRATRIPAAHGPMLFKTFQLGPQYFKTPYKGVRQTGSADFTVLNNTLVKNLYDFYSGINETTFSKAPFHFFIFGDTVVQVSYLSPDHFMDTPDKDRIYIGVAHKNRLTNQALINLKQALGVCMVKRGDLAEVTPSTLELFLK